MAMMCPEITLFPFIQPTHAFHAHTERFQARLDAEPSCAERMNGLLSGASPDRPSADSIHIHTLIRGQLTADRGWELEGFHTSLQVRDASRRRPFRALTLHYAPDAGQVDCWEFTRDPYLPGLASVLNRHGILWYCIAWEIQHLARRLKRDQFHPVAFDRAIALIGDLSEQLRGER